MKTNEILYMVTFNYSNVNEVSKADIVIIGVPDESKSHSKRKGTIKGPDIFEAHPMNITFLREEEKLFRYVQCAE